MGVDSFNEHHTRKNPSISLVNNQRLMAASKPIYLCYLDCVCAGCGDPAIVSYDGAIENANENAKYSLSGWGQWAPAPVDYLCQFGLRMVTMKNFGGNPSPLYIDWTALGVGVKLIGKKPNQTPVKGVNFRSFLMGQDSQGFYRGGQRGQGFKKPKPFPDAAVVKQTFGGKTCYWTITKQNNNLAEVRSSCCPYALNWRPKGLDTCWEFYVDSKKYGGVGGKMSALCGDCDGNNINDYRTCPSGANPPNPYDAIIAQPMTDAKLETIAKSCKDAKHDGQGFPGGWRLGA